MSHFTVLVIGDNPEQQLEPYNENTSVPEYFAGEVDEAAMDDFVAFYEKEKGAKGTFEQIYKKHGKDWNSGRWRKHADGTWHEYSTYNKRSKWDWYSIGGRWKGFFKLKKGAEGELGESGVFGNKAKFDADQCKLKDIDFEGMRKKARAEAKKRYKEFYKALGEHPMPPKFSEFRDKDCGGDINLARQRYHELPAIQALGAAGIHLFFGDYVDIYGCSEEEFCDREVACVAVPFAVVKDGEWYEKGKVGWFGMAHDEMSQEIWNKKVQEMYQDLDPETLVTLFDCHI